MVALRLELEGLDTLPDGGPTSFEVKGRRTVEIGRNTFLDWTLPDTDRVVSGKHCEISWRDGAYVLTDLSTNGTFVNGSEARLTEPRRLRSGDRISVGRYHIRVVVEDDDAPTAPREAPPADPARPGFGGRHTFSSLWDVPADETAPPAPVAGPAGPSSRPVHADMLDWVADIPSVDAPSAPARADAAWSSPPAGPAAPAARWAPPVEPLPAAAAQQPPAGAAWPAEPNEPPPSTPDLATGDGGARQPPVAPPPVPASPAAQDDAPASILRAQDESPAAAWTGEADDARSFGAQEPDEVHALSGGTPLSAAPWPTLGDAAPADAGWPEVAPPPPSLAPAQIPERPASLDRQLGRTATGHPFTPPPAAAHPAAGSTPGARMVPAELVATEMPRRPSAETPFTADPALSRRGGSDAPEPPARTAADGDLGRFVAALSAELGIPEQRIGTLPPDRLGKLLGRFMRRTVEGLHELLRARSVARGFMRSGRGTMVEAIGNNPLKFMPTNAALEVLLAPSNNAYLDADATLDDSFRDLSAHQVAVYVAMQAALTRLLSDIEPSVIEAADEGKTSGGLLGGGANARKARLWDLYRTRYTARAEAHDKGMVDVFMLYFADAYERAVRDEDTRRDRAAAGQR